MTRVVKKPEVRRDEILDAARKSFFERGYDQTTIQTIIGELGIAKGTFYHYFRSKMDLLDELTDRVTSEISRGLTRVLNSDMDAIDKFNAIFRAGTALKAANIDLFVVLLRVLFRDENTIIREKMYRRIVEKNTPLFSEVIRQGTREGLFDTHNSDDVAQMILQIGKDLNETVSRLLLAEDKKPEHLVRVIRRKVKLYEDAIERILGAPPGSIKVYLANEFENMVRYLTGEIRKDRREETERM
jgi:AcrR family transcriptional regulator